MLYLKLPKCLISKELCTVISLVCFIKQIAIVQGVSTVFPVRLPEVSFRGFCNWNIHTVFIVLMVLDVVTYCLINYS